MPKIKLWKKYVVQSQKNDTDVWYVYAINPYHHFLTKIIHLPLWPKIRGEYFFHPKKKSSKMHPVYISIPYQNLFPYHLIHLQQTVTYDFAISFAHPHFHIITSHFCKRLPTILNKPDIKAKSNFMATYKIQRNDNYFLR